MSGYDNCNGGGGKEQTRPLPKEPRVFGNTRRITHTKQEKAGDPRPDLSRREVLQGWVGMRVLVVTNCLSTRGGGRRVGVYVGDAYDGGGVDLSY